MLFLLSTLGCVILLSAFFVCVWIRHSPQERKFLAPAIVLLIGYIVVDQLLFSLPQYAHIFIPLRLYVQILLCPACLLFSISYARETSLKDLKSSDKFILVFSLLTLLVTLLFPSTAFYYQTDFTIEPVIFLEQASFYLYLFIVIMYVISIGNLESTLRNSKHSEQWRIKIALFGLGVGFAFLMIFASQGLLYKTIDLRKIPLRNLGVIVGCILVLYSELKRKSNEVFISRKIVFRSGVAVLASFYFIGIGLYREGNRVFGGFFSEVLMIAVAGILICLFIAAMLSQKVRRALSIWIQRNFYNEKYDYRAQWMQFSEYLSHSVEYNAFINAALMNFCETFGRLGAVYISVDTETPNSMGQVYYYEISDDSEPLSEETFQELLHNEPRPILVNGDEPYTLSSEIIMSLLSMQIGIVLPIRAADTPEGLLLLGHPMNGKEKYDNEDFELMEAMGRQIGLSAKSFRVSEAVALSREIKVFDKLGTFVLHDLKNQVYALSLLTDNARNYIKEPAFQDDMLETLSSTVSKMKVLISQLAHLANEDDLQIKQVDLQKLAKKIASQIPHAPISITGKELTVAADEAQLGKVFLNLYLNSIEAGGDKPITVTVDMEDSVPVVHVHDMAGGLAPEVLEMGLFKPFNTTKARGMGIGLYHSRKILEAHGAKIHAHNRPGEGCTFTLRFEDEHSQIAS